jgi:hypothetical protein
MLGNFCTVYAKLVHRSDASAVQQILGSGMGSSERETGIDEVRGMGHGVKKIRLF